MAKKLDPLISEFDTQEEADAHDAWFRAQVEQALNEPGASYTHEEAMAHAVQAIEEEAARGPAKPLAADGKLDPIISEFETQEQADRYDVWYRTQVQAGLDDTGPRIPHAEVMREMRAIVDAALAEQLKSGR